MSRYASKRWFVCYFFFVDWTCLSLGFHVDLGLPNIEIHVPFGFIRIGWHAVSRGGEQRKRQFGYSSEKDDYIWL